MGEAAGAITEARPVPRPIPAVDLIVRAAEMIFNGRTATDIARKLSLPYPAAARLYEQVYQEVYGRIRDRYDPEVLATMKDELREKLLKEVRNCDRAVDQSFRDRKPNTRPYTHMNAAVKLLNAMNGFNAPIKSENLDLRVNATVNPEVQARIMADPEARAALLKLEEFASRQVVEVEIGGGA